MKADTTFILVIDSAPERAEQVNSLLRNSGINTHVLFASEPVEAERIAREFRPILAVYHPAAQQQFPVGRAAELARQLQMFLAIRFMPEQVDCYLQALTGFSCLGVHAGHDDQLTELVRYLGGVGRAAREQSTVREHEQELEAINQLLLQSTSDPIAYLHEGLHVHANAAYLEMMHIRDEQELQSLSLLEMASSSDDDLKALIRDFGHNVYPQSALQAEIRPRHGEPFTALLSFDPIRFNQESCVQMVIRRLSTQAAIQPEVAQAAALDPLTGLHYRSAYMRALDDRLTGAPSEQQSAVFHLEPDGIHDLAKDLSVAELDGFISELAKVISGQLEPNDLAGRFSDYSIGIQAFRESKTQLKKLAESIRMAAEDLGRRRPGQVIPQTCSIGLIMLGGQTRDAEESVMLAQQAWEQAATETNVVKQFKPALKLDENADDESKWSERIRYALNNEDFYSVQHSIMNLEGESEGLFENRTFLHEDSGDHPLDAFLSVAERNDLASTIDRQIIPGLLSAISGTGDRHIINISGNSVQDFSFANWFRRQMREHEVVGSQVILQMPSDAARDNLRAARRLIEELAPQGCSFSVSQFNSDKKTCDLIAQLNLSFIKLDHRLTADLKHSQEQMSAIKNIVHEADSESAMTIAGDVENSGDMATLWQCGVKLVSGEFLQDSPRVIGQ